MSSWETPQPKIKVPPHWNIWPRVDFHYRTRPTWSGSDNGVLSDLVLLSWDPSLVESHSRLIDAVTHASDQARHIHRHVYVSVCVYNSVCVLYEKCACVCMYVQVLCISVRVCVCILCVMLCVYMFVLYVCMCLCVLYMYVYEYVSRIWMCICVCVCIYMYPGAWISRKWNEYPENHPG